MRFVHGFLNKQIEFVPTRRATEEEQSRLPFHCWYEWAEEESSSITDALASAIDSLPPEPVFMVGGSMLDRSVVSFARGIRSDIETRTLTLDDVQPYDVRMWVEMNRTKYCLVDRHLAIVLWVCEMMVQEGNTVVLVGPFPSIEDATWVRIPGASRYPFGPTEAITSPTPRWTILDHVRQVAPFRIAEDRPGLIPSLALRMLAPFIRRLRLPEASADYRMLGVRSIDGDSLARVIDPCAQSVGKEVLSLSTLPIIHRDSRDHFRTKLEVFL